MVETARRAPRTFTSSAQRNQDAYRDLVNALDNSQLLAEARDKRNELIRANLPEGASLSKEDCRDITNAEANYIYAVAAEKLRIDESGKPLSFDEAQAARRKAGEELEAAYLKHGFGGKEEGRDKDPLMLGAAEDLANFQREFDRTYVPREYVETAPTDAGLPVAAADTAPVAAPAEAEPPLAHATLEHVQGQTYAGQCRRDFISSINALMDTHVQSASFTL